MQQQTFRQVAEMISFANQNIKGHHILCYYDSEGLLQNNKRVTENVKHVKCSEIHQVRSSNSSALWMLTESIRY